MLRIKNASGEDMLILQDDGSEEFTDKKVKESYEKAKLEQKDEE